MKLSYGIGYDSGGKYKKHVKSKITKEYQTWRNMLARCYGKAFAKIRPTYEGCSVDPEWHDYQKFAEWCYEQEWFGVKGYQLDKDILVDGNKIYGPNTCAFVPSQINSLLLDGNKKTDLPKGVCFLPEYGKYRVSVSKIRTLYFTGYYDTVELAEEAYWRVKVRVIHEVAEEWRDLIPEKVYNKLIKFGV